MTNARTKRSSAASGFAFTVDRILPAAPEAVFAALTEARRIAAWSGQAGVVPAVIGGTMEMFDGWVSGVVLAYAPGSHTAFTWLPNDWPAGSQASIVTYRLARVPGGTRLSIHHAGFPDATRSTSHRTGWTQFVLDPLAEYLSTHHS